MDADPATIAAQCPGIELQTVERFLGRLTIEYFDRFPPPAIAAHVQALGRLSPENPVEVLLRQEGSRVSCTVIAFDHPFELSMITGVLSSMGLRIDRGDIFTLRPPAPPESLPPRESRRRPPSRPSRLGEAAAARRDPLARAVIVDHFEASHDGPDPFGPERAEQLRSRLAEVLSLLEKDDQASIEKAKRRVNELVTQRLAGLKVSASAALAPVRIDVLPSPSDRTRLRITAEDTPAFLYSLATALSLHGFSIERVQISGDGSLVEDEIDLVGADGQPLGHLELERVRLSVLLTKQFTYFLGKAPDPFAALTRFEELTEQIVHLPSAHEWIDVLTEPQAMQDLAKLLGTSDFLWEDFIRQQHEALLPIFLAGRGDPDFGRPAETLPLRLEKALAGAQTLEEKQDRLNRFKDEEIFYIDLKHILNPVIDFRELSERLTGLAEHLISQATRIVHDDLTASFGAPRDGAGRPAAHAVFGLGKLGGVALGYASDIELLFVYSDAGKTAGGSREPITNAEFYEALARNVSQFIRTRSEGIFQVDLRLRPYSTKGPLASSRRELSAYYAPGGPAHAFERLALVRLRWIAGDPRLGFAVEELRDEIVYGDAPLELDALWDLWEKRHELKARAGQINAKHSPGALTDLEGVVMLLQVRYAREVPQLRTPELAAVLEGLRRGGVLPPDEYADLLGAYRFLRRLINALRMLRGNAQDLFVPPAGSDDLVHLARRCGYEQKGDHTPAEQLLEELERRTRQVRLFIRKRFGRPCPGTKGED